MKKFFFSLLMISSALLSAVSNEQMNIMQDVSDELLRLQEPFNQSSKEFRCWPHHRCKNKKNKKNHCKDEKVIPIKIEDSQSYGSFFTEDFATVTTGPGIDERIIFNRVSFSTRDIVLQPFGVILLTEKGDYEVEFGARASTEAATPVPRIVLLVNGLPQAGSNISLSPLPQLIPTTIFQGELESVSTTIRVVSTLTALTVVNNGTTDFSTNPVVPGDLSAFITIHKLSE